MFLNNSKFERFSKEMTLLDLIKMMNYTYPMLRITINGIIIERKDYSTTKINIQDDVKIRYLLAGG